MRRLVKNRFVLYLLIGMICYIAWLATTMCWSYWRIPQDVKVLAREGRVDLRLTLRFPVEQFHVRLLQKFGRVTNVTGCELTIRDVGFIEVIRIGQFFWVRDIRKISD